MKEVWKQVLYTYTYQTEITQAELCDAECQTDEELPELTIG